LAKVRTFTRETVKTFAGFLDFYYWKGIPCVRSWPRRQTTALAPSRIAAQNAFTISRKYLKEMDPGTRLAWLNAFPKGKIAWLDQYTGLFMEYYSQTGTVPPQITNFSSGTDGDDTYISFTTSREGTYKASLYNQPLTTRPRVTRFKGRPDRCIKYIVPEPYRLYYGHGSAIAEMDMPYLSVYDRDRIQSPYTHTSYSEAVRKACAYLSGASWTYQPGTTVRQDLYTYLRYGRYTAWIEQNRAYYYTDTQNWWDTFPDQHPTQLRYTYHCTGYSDCSGGFYVPQWNDQIFPAQLDQNIIEFDAAEIDIPDGLWQFYFRPYPYKECWMDTPPFSNWTHYGFQHNPTNHGLLTFLLTDQKQIKINVPTADISPDAAFAQVVDTDNIPLPAPPVIFH